MRTATIERETKETTITLTLALDGAGTAEVATGIGFLDHMLTLLARHGGFDLCVRGAGDLHVDDHHLTEDLGIVLGQALKQALGDKSGIRRYASITLPMDEALVLCALDCSGRPFYAWEIPLPHGKVGTWDSELAEDFFRALAVNAGLTLHLRLLAGTNTHHVIEAAFKATARALREAVSLDPRETGVPSTKGMLE